MKIIEKIKAEVELNKKLQIKHIKDGTLYYIVRDISMEELEKACDSIRHKTLLNEGESSFTKGISLSRLKEICDAEKKDRLLILSPFDGDAFMDMHRTIEFQWITTTTVNMGEFIVEMNDHLKSGHQIMHFEYDGYNNIRVLIRIA